MKRYNTTLGEITGVEFGQAKNPKEHWITNRFPDFFVDELPATWTLSRTPHNYWERADLYCRVRAGELGGSIRVSTVGIAYSWVRHRCRFLPDHAVVAYPVGKKPFWFEYGNRMWPREIVPGFDLYLNIRTKSRDASLAIGMTGAAPQMFAQFGPCTEGGFVGIRSQYDYRVRRA